MVIERIILEEINNIIEISKRLIESLDETPILLTQKETIKLRLHMEKQEEISNLQSEHIQEIRLILNSTHYKKLSDFINSTSNQQLSNSYKTMKELLYTIIIKSNSNRKLLEDCQRINNTQLNLFIGKKQEPTNYNLSTLNINSHLLNKFKNNI